MKDSCVAGGVIEHVLIIDFQVGSKILLKEENEYNNKMKISSHIEDNYGMKFTECNFNQRTLTSKANDQLTKYTLNNVDNVYLFLAEFIVLTN